jgi:hypothetical protein
MKLLGLTILGAVPQSASVQCHVVERTSDPDNPARKRRTIVRRLFLLMLLTSLAFGQTKIPIQAAPDDPKVFRYFFEGSMPSAIAINAADAAKFNSVFQAANRNLSTVESQRQQYLALMLKQHKKPSPKALQGFEAAKNVHGVAGTYQMRRTLSPQGWQQVRAHVNGVFAKTLTVPH